MRDISVFCKKAIYSHVLSTDVIVQTKTMTNPQHSSAVADWLNLHGFQAIWPKVADGPSIFRYMNQDTRVTEDNISPESVKLFKSAGLTVIGWGFLYGKDPVGEANIAVVQINRLGLDGYIFDVEGAFDECPAAEAAAYTITRIVRQACPDLPLAYCGWPRHWNPRKPYDNLGTWHPVRVAQAFMSVCDVAAPMMYWDGKESFTAIELFKQSLEQYARITNKPVIPTGRAYIGDGGQATVEAIVAFQSKVEQSCLGISWWFLNHAAKYPEIATGLNFGKQFGFVKPITTTPVVPLTIEERLQRLEKAVFA
jgi:hypothetical protein